MKLGKKKELAIRTLKVGRKRIIFVKSRLEDIKEAITKQDIRDLVADNAIVIKEQKGRTKIREKARKSTGNIKKKVKTRKQDYVKLSRKLRSYVAELQRLGKIGKEEVKEIRKKIRNKQYRSKANLKEHIGGVRK